MAGVYEKVFSLACSVHMTYIGNLLRHFASIAHVMDTPATKVSLHFPSWLTEGLMLLTQRLLGVGGKVTFLLKENIMGGFCHSAVRVNYF